MFNYSILTGVFFIIISDILLNFTGRKITTDLIYIMIPILSFFLIYQILIFKLRIKQ